MHARNYLIQVSMAHELPSVWVTQRFKVFVVLCAPKSISQKRVAAVPAAQRGLFDGPHCV